ncbi:HlyC/CorC family transporter [Oceanicoccus sp. KOV_DT_Chl]|uniref:HlyC/CorC family transporter n=1 Tax=Oceanicoccus sp. KOV_DT_Chl TaxID=1904639 RepID=UPI000C7D1466|nr:HlyC/CorC family transporter [Oceanicoccus sp. KOV_DT_Chl]
MNELSLELLFAILAVLLMLSAFFSSAETGMMSLNRYRLKHLRNKGHKGAIRASKLLKYPDRLISLILIGNNLVNFIGASLFTVIVIRLWGEAASVVIGPIILTLVFLIFAEITPKTIAAFYPEKIAFPASNILTPLLFILYPLVWFINNITNRILRLIGIDTRLGNQEQLSPEELRTIVGEAGPHIPQRHQGMLLNILDLEQASVEDIMIPRNEIVGIDLNDDDLTLLEHLRSLEFTRIPVFKDDVNNVVGIFHQRNISRVIDENGNLDRNSLMSQIREPYFTPEITPLHMQLVNFQHQKRRMGIVVDEYGVVQGLVTLEDILEEIVGEFTSNMTSQLRDIHSQQDGSFIINGTTTIREVNKSLGWELPTEGPKTLSGLLLENLESFPDAQVGVTINNYHFEILEIKDNIAKTVKAIAFEGPEQEK